MKIKVEDDSELANSVKISDSERDALFKGDGDDDKQSAVQSNQDTSENKESQNDKKENTSD